MLIQKVVYLLENLPQCFRLGVCAFGSHRMKENAEINVFALMWSIKEQLLGKPTGFINIPSLL